MRKVTLGMIVGNRPAALNTVRYSEKILEAAGIAVEPVDPYEIFGEVGRLADNDIAVKTKLSVIKSYTDTAASPAAGLLKTAKFGAVVDSWMKEEALASIVIRCWTAMEESFGIVPCAVISILSQSLLPSACEVDVTGLPAMCLLQLASGTPNALLDGNSNLADELDECVLFHCSNLPKSFLQADKTDCQEIVAGSVGRENTYGTMVGRIKASPATFCRTMTDDSDGDLQIVREVTGLPDMSF